MQISSSKMKWCIAIFGLSALLFGCQGPKRPFAQSTLAAPIQEKTESVEVTSPLPSTATAIAATSTATPTPRKTATAVPTPTWTRLPTINPTLASDQIHKLMADNGGCVFPCWWGITPGQTTWNEVYAFLAPFPLSEDGPALFPFQDPTRFLAEFLIQHDNDGLIYPGFTFQNNILRRVHIRFASVYSYSPSDIIRQLGTPGEVRFGTYRDATQEGVDPFYMIMFYPDRGVLAFFDDQTKMVNHFVEMCYREHVDAETVTDLTLWPENQPLRFEEAETEFGLQQLVPVEILKSIDEATSISVEQFAAFFRGPASTKCLKTPANRWKGIYE